MLFLAHFLTNLFIGPSKFILLATSFSTDIIKGTSVNCKVLNNFWWYLILRRIFPLMQLLLELLLFWDINFSTRRGWYFHRQQSLQDKSQQCFLLLYFLLLFPFYMCRVSFISASYLDISALFCFSYVPSSFSFVTVCPSCILRQLFKCNSYITDFFFQSVCLYCYQCEFLWSLPRLLYFLFVVALPYYTPFLFLIILLSFNSEVFMLLLNT